jgi:hypothetical protein
VNPKPYIRSRSRGVGKIVNPKPYIRSRSRGVGSTPKAYTGIFTTLMVKWMAMIPNSGWDHLRIKLPWLETMLPALVLGGVPQRCVKSSFN